jgi:tetratricopeptide (TPR) repeat protein
MNTYPRKPALIILSAALVVGLLYVAAWGTVERMWKKQPGAQGIEALKKKIAAGDHSAATWYAYGDALADAKRFEEAAAAFKQVLAIEPFKREAKFQCGLALAQASDGNKFYEFQKDLVYSEPKMAVELFERPEARRFLSEERFSALATEAKSQAMD